MPFIKNPFARDSAKEQLNPDFLAEKKIDAAAGEIKKSAGELEIKAVAGLENAAADKLASVDNESSGLPSAAAPALAAPPSKSINRQKIEGIMEEGLEEIYFSLDSAHQRLFKEEGERAANQIEQIVMVGKNVAVKILEVIKRWLRLIPGVNKFFLEQEAKIKTDKILKATEKDV